MLVARHLTPVIEPVSEWAEFRTSVAKKSENYTSDLEGWKIGEKEFVEQTRVNKKRAKCQICSLTVFGQCTS